MFKERYGEWSADIYAGSETWTSNHTSKSVNKLTEYKALV